MKRDPRMERRWNARAGETGVPRENAPQAASSSTIPTCENPGANPTGIEPGSPWWEAIETDLLTNSQCDKRTESLQQSDAPGREPATTLPLSYGGSPFIYNSHLQIVLHLRVAVPAKTEITNTLSTLFCEFGQNVISLDSGVAERGSKQTNNSVRSDSPTARPRQARFSRREREPFSPVASLQHKHARPRDVARLSPPTSHLIFSWRRTNSEIIWPAVTRCLEKFATSTTGVLNSTALVFKVVGAPPPLPPQGRRDDMLKGGGAVPSKHLLYSLMYTQVVRWLSAVAVEGDDWASVLLEVSKTVCGPMAKGRVVKCCKVSRRLLTAVQSRCTRQEPATTAESPEKLNASPQFHKRAARDPIPGASAFRESIRGQARSQCPTSTAPTSFGSWPRAYARRHSTGKLTQSIRCSRWHSGQTARLPLRRTGLDSGLGSCPYFRTCESHWTMPLVSGFFLAGIPFPRPCSPSLVHTQPRYPLIRSQDLDVKSLPLLCPRHCPLEINLRKMSLLLPACILTGALSDMRPVKLVTMDGNLRGLCSCASKVKKRGNDTGDTNTHVERLIAPTRKARSVSAPYRTTESANSLWSLSHFNCAGPLTCYANDYSLQRRSVSTALESSVRLRICLVDRVKIKMTNSFHLGSTEHSPSARGRVTSTKIRFLQPYYVSLSVKVLSHDVLILLLLLLLLDGSFRELMVGRLELQRRIRCEARGGTNAPRLTVLLIAQLGTGEEWGEVPGHPDQFADRYLPRARQQTYPPARAWRRKR
ncbi:hypothetical protein PR048_031420 [Dryococelus australis]|uniref:Uncharacterized protein n=1 Tax=Dryococelus australis TaxID=614101 RepID=A0ABQ9G6A6_9NEOP|nr:hypothetical protein PR048_031420 [Dryococelus australis]